MSPSHRYDLIKESDDGKDEPQTPRSPVNTPWWKFLSYMLLAASAGFGAAFGAVLALSLLKGNETAAGSVAPNATLSASITPTLALDLALPTSSADADEHEVHDPESLAGKVLECGYSPEEARERGCVYDVMMQDWVPEPCFDEILTERFLASNNFTWYSDPEGTVMSDEEMRKGEHHAAWMGAGYHKAHCIFSWEKLIRALRNNEPISQELLSYDHVLHCRHQTLGGEMHNKRGDGGIGVYAPTNYAKCALYNTWRNDFLPDKHASNDK